jgi:mono/diheme cytochrome c family protein
MTRWGGRALFGACLLAGLASAAGSWPRAAAAQSLPALYTWHCSGCHGAAGHGVPEQGIPDLHDAGLYAGLPAGRAYLAQVPGLAQSRLDDATAAALLTYVLRRFSGDRLPADFRPYTAAELKALRADTASDAARRRRQILAISAGGSGH